MAAKDIAFDNDARERILRGVQKLSRAVKVTLGPSGKVVVIQKSYGSPTVTKDGVSVAKEIELPDAYENIGAQMIKEVATKSSRDAGDGTTTATILAEAIYQEGLKNITAGANANEIKRGIDKAVSALVNELKAVSKDIVGKDEIKQVATCSANGDKDIGKIIADAMDKVGKDGVVTVEEGKSLETELSFVEGMDFDKGYLSPHFITNLERMECVLENPFIFIHEGRLNNIHAILPLLNKCAESQRPLFIIAEDVENEVLAALVINKLRSSLKSCAVKSPGFGDRRKEMLQDIAVLTKAQAFMNDLSMDISKAELSQLGTAKKIIITKDSTIIVEGPGDTNERVQQIRTQIADSDSEYDREKLQERLAKLVGGVAQIQVGAATETEMKEKKDRVEDALHASRAAMEEGILPGGGIAILKARKALVSLRKKLNGDERTGVDIIHRAVVAPAKQIAENCGVEGSVVVSKIEENPDPEFGFNAATQEYENLFKSGIIVPTKVERVALQNAASIAGLLLTMDTVIVERKEKAEQEAHQHQHQL